MKVFVEMNYRHLWKACFFSDISKAKRLRFLLRSPAALLGTPHADSFNSFVHWFGRRTTPRLLIDTFGPLHVFFSANHSSPNAPCLPSFPEECGHFWPNVGKLNIHTFSALRREEGGTLAICFDTRKHQYMNGFFHHGCIDSFFWIWVPTQTNRMGEATLNSGGK